MLPDLARSHPPEDQRTITATTLEVEEVVQMGQAESTHPFADLQSHQLHATSSLLLLEVVGQTSRTLT